MNSSGNVQKAAGTILVKPQTTRQIHYGEGVYNEAMHFLIEEAFLLDEGAFSDWLKLLAEDVMVTMPTRESVHRHDGSGFSPSMVWIRDDMSALAFKVKRLESDSAFNEDPPSRIRRLISNMRMFETTTPNEYLAQNALLLRRSRGEAHIADELSARRDDVLRRTKDGWKLARRTIFVDQSVLGTPNLAIFL